MTFTKWRVVWELTSHRDEKCEAIFNEWWCESWHHITTGSVRLYSIKGGVSLYITSQWEVWDYTQWRVVWELTSHHNEKCEAIFNEWWCESWHHITMRRVRLYSMNGGVWVYTLVADRSVMAAWLLSFCVAMCVERCGFGTWRCKTHCNGCMDVAWASFWGKPGQETLCFFRVKWLRPAMKGTSCVRRVRLGSNRARIGSSSVFCNEWLFMCAWFFAFLDSLVADRSVMAAWLLSFCVAMCVERCGFGTWRCKTHCNGCMDVAWASFWGKPGQETLCFFRVKWLRPAMKGTSCVRRVRLGSNRARIGSSSVFCNEWLFMCAWFFAFLDSLVADRSVMAAWLLSFCVAMCVERCGFGTWRCKTHCNGCMDVAWASFWGKPGQETLCFFRVKWLRPAMKGTSCVRRVRLGSNRARIGSSSVFCNEWLFMCAWFFAFLDSLVADRSVMAAWLLSFCVAMCVERCGFGTWRCKTHCNGCMDVAWASFWGKPGQETLCFFRVKWLRPAMKGTSCVRRVRLGSNRARIGSSSVFCNEWLFMCAWFFAFLDSLVADRSVMAAWLLSFCVAMCVERCGFGTWCCKTQCTNIIWME